VKRRPPDGSLLSDTVTNALGDRDSSQSSKAAVVCRMRPAASTTAARRRPSFDTTNQWPASPRIFSGVAVKLEMSDARVLPPGGPTLSCTLPSAVKRMVASLLPLSSKAKASCNMPSLTVTLPEGLSCLGAAPADKAAKNTNPETPSHIEMRAMPR
jgi:hypothetical protein